MKEYHHVPVLLEEVREYIRPSASGRYADGTLGGGGHAEMILSASSPGGWLGGCDRDGVAVEAASSRLAPFSERLEIRRGVFASLADWIPPGSLDGVLVDLGVSLPQLTWAERGFSVQHDGPLDMRMDQEQTMTAEELVNERSPEELASVFWELGGERQSRRIARAIEHERMIERIVSTLHLARVVESAKPRRGKVTHPATKVFQALRMAVNDEIGELNRGLQCLAGLLKPGGRLLVITFHSGEDRAVKRFGREEARDYDLPGNEDVPALRVPRSPRMRWVKRKAICAGEKELESNPSARSAQLRVLEKMGEKVTN